MRRVPCNSASSNWLALRLSDLCPTLNEEERPDVVSPPFGTPAFEKGGLTPMTALSRTAVSDDHHRIVADVVSSDVIVQICFITIDDEEPADHPPAL